MPQHIHESIQTPGGTLPVRRQCRSSVCVCARARRYVWLGTAGSPSLATSKPAGCVSGGPREHKHAHKCKHTALRCNHGRRERARKSAPHVLLCFERESVRSIRCASFERAFECCSPFTRREIERERESDRGFCTVLPMM